MVQILTRIAFVEGKVYKVVLETKDKYVSTFEKVKIYDISNKIGFISAEFQMCRKTDDFVNYYYKYYLIGQ